jgi:hypothetical protein
MELRPPGPSPALIRSGCQGPAPGCDTECTHELTTRPVAVVAALAGLSLLVAACAGGAAHNGVASLGQSTTTTTAQSGAPAAGSPGGEGQSPSVGGGGGSPSSGGQFFMRTGGSYSQDLELAEYVGLHGLPNFPDPGSNGTFQLNGSEYAANSPQFQNAQKECRKFVPNGGAPPPPAQQAKMLSQLLQFSECVRSHGITQFPDPQSINGNVRLVFTPNMGIDPNSPQFQAAQKACQKFNPIPPP